MPAHDYTQIGMLCTQQFMSTFAGAQLWKRVIGGVDRVVTAPATWGNFTDIHHLLHGMGAVPAVGSNQAFDLAALIEFYSDLAGIEDYGWEVSLTTQDLIRIDNSVDIPFKVKKYGYQPWFGFGASYTDSFTAGAETYVIAPNDYKRGVIPVTSTDDDGGKVGLTIEVSTVGGPVTFDVILPSRYYQGALEVVRLMAQGDALAENSQDNLTYLDNDDAIAAGSTWVLGDSGDEAGKVVVTYSINLPSGNIQWLSTTFRDWLGFDGTEAPIEVLPPGGIGAGDPTNYKLVASHPPQGILWLDRAIEYLEPHLEAVRFWEVCADGREKSAHVLTREGWNLRVSIAGLSSTVDRLMFAHEDFFKYFWRSEFFTVYNNVNERRVGARVKSKYSLAVTGEDDYRVGTIRLTPDASFRKLQFDPDKPGFRHQYFLDIPAWKYVAA